MDRMHYKKDFGHHLEDCTIKKMAQFQCIVEHKSNKTICRPLIRFYEICTGHPAIEKILSDSEIQEILAQYKRPV
jgi:hypothetical protein